MTTVSGSRPGLLAPPDDQRVTFVELFFDLVFVFSITQVTGLLHDGITAGAAGRAALVFWLVWWAWTQFTWALNAANTEHGGVRAATLLATLVAFFMAVGVPDTFHGHALWFAVPYVAVRLIGLGTYLAIAWSDATFRSAVLTFGVRSLGGLAVVLVGAVADESARPAWWGAAIALDVIAAAVGGRLEGWNLHPGHFLERHGLIVIIALGESLIIAAGGMAGVDRTLELVGVAVLAVVLTSVMWWSYFAQVLPRLEHALAAADGTALSMMARDIGSLAHFPMLCGVIGFAAAAEEAIAHPDEPLASGGRLALAVGVGAFLGGAGLAEWRALGRAPVGRLVTAMAAALAIWTVGHVAPTVSLGVGLAGALVVLAVDALGRRDRPTSVAQR